MCKLWYRTPVLSTLAVREKIPQMDPSAPLALIMESYIPHFGIAMMHPHFS